MHDNTHGLEDLQASRRVVSSSLQAEADGSLNESSKLGRCMSIFTNSYVHFVRSASNFGGRTPLAEEQNSSNQSEQTHQQELLCSEQNNRP